MNDGKLGSMMQAYLYKNPGLHSKHNAYIRDTQMNVDQYDMVNV
jgi:hypothetical protein